MFKNKAILNTGNHEYAKIYNDVKLTVKLLMTDLMNRDSYYTFANEYSLEKQPNKINQKGLMMMLARVDKLKAAKIATT